jgi:hypothetical protein
MDTRTFTRGISRWMYRGQHPNRIAKLMNRMAAMQASAGIGASFGLVALEVIGRISGKPITLPLVMVGVEGQRYVASMLGNDVHWVQNVRAAGGRAVLHNGHPQDVRLDEVPANRRAPILKVYLQRAPGARPHVPVDKDAPLADFERIASDYPVFRVSPPTFS